MHNSLIRFDGHHIVSLWVVGLFSFGFFVLCWPSVVPILTCVSAYVLQVECATKSLSSELAQILPLFIEAGQKDRKRAISAPTRAPSPPLQPY